MWLIAASSLQVVLLGILGLIAGVAYIASISDGLIESLSRFEPVVAKRIIPRSLIAIVFGPIMALVLAGLGSILETSAFERQATFDRVLFVTLLVTMITTIGLGVSDIVRYFRRPNS